MRLKSEWVLLAIIIIGLSYDSSQACSFPLVNPPPYTFTESWQPGPHAVHLSIDDIYNLTVTEQLGHGVFNWNIWGLADCSLIEFVGGENTHFDPGVYANTYRVPPWTRMMRGLGAGLGMYSWSERRKNQVLFR